MNKEQQRIAIAADRAKDSARARVRAAVRYGRITKPTICPKCGTEYPVPEIHAHHHNGYDNWNDFVWRCYRCHDEDEPGAKARFGLSNGAHTKPERRPRGSLHGKTVLTDKQVAMIRSSSGKGTSLARTFNVHPATISRLRLGRYRT